MPALLELASMIRSKNAGPFWITIDVIFRDAETYRTWSRHPALSRAAVARMFGRDELEVTCYECPAAAALKFSFERLRASGSSGDRDVFGCQQHAPLSTWS